MGEKIYMEITEDEYELPVVIADSRIELSKVAKVTKSTITKCLNRGSKRSKYIEIDLENENFKEN